MHNEFELYGRFCGYYRTLNLEKAERDEKPKKLSADEQRKLDAKERVCMNWACGQRYTQAKNHKRACRCHTGRWDFGHTGLNVKQMAGGIVTPQDLMWMPHWSCCRKDWDADGCTKMPHNGPYVEEAEEQKFKWPDTKAQYFFKKTHVSKLWKKKLEDHCNYDETDVNRAFNWCLSNVGSAGVIFQVFTHFLL